jgi:hypothetical protein
MDIEIVQSLPNRRRPEGEYKLILDKVKNLTEGQAIKIKQVKYSTCECFRYHVNRRSLNVQVFSRKDLNTGLFDIYLTRKWFEDSGKK